MKRLRLILIFLILSRTISAQDYDINWLITSGYPNIYFNTFVHFPPAGGSPQFSTTTGHIPFSYANACISDEHGNFLFSSNGVNLYNKLYQQIPGAIISTPQTQPTQHLGLNRTHSCFFLPWPDDTNRYVLIYSIPELTSVASGPCSGGWGNLATHVYYTVLDKNLNGGMGGIITASNIAVTDTLAHIFGLTACKHANGRDWWIFAKERCTNVYDRFLLTPGGIQFTGKIFAGPVITASDGAISGFSNNGNYMYNIVNDTVCYLYKFDRCAGTFLDTTSLRIPWPGEFYSAFSQNSEILYRAAGNSGTNTSQYDLTKWNQPGGVLASRLLIDPVVDTVTCTNQSPGSGSAAGHPKLAPDGKIYFGHYYPCNLSVINFPNSLDTICQMEYNTVLVPTPHTGGLPHMPNYRLGPVTGSICDSLTAVHELKSDEVSLYPNPAKDHITLQSKRSISNAVITLMNVQGQVLLSRQTGTGTGFEVELPRDMDNGIYFLRIHSTEGAVAKKVVVQR
ncbi:MAG: T9SS type A sorting domain-containing protein [Bacteroidia bacterium]